MNWTLGDSNVPLVNRVDGLAIGGTLLFNNEASQTIGGEDLDIFADKRGGERGYEKFRYQINVFYPIDRFSFLWQVNHTSKGYFNLDASEEAFADPTYSPFTVHNFSTQFQVTDAIRASLVVNNVFDNMDDASQVAQVGRQGVFRDLHGRRFVFGMNFRF